MALQSTLTSLLLLLLHLWLRRRLYPRRRCCPRPWRRRPPPRCQIRRVRRPCEHRQPNVHVMSHGPDPDDVRDRRSAAIASLYHDGQPGRPDCHKGQGRHAHLLPRAGALSLWVAAPWLVLLLLPLPPPLLLLWLLLLRLLLLLPLQSRDQHLHTDRRTSRLPSFARCTCARAATS
jgi:hypothetical protein